jgi:hypothetical protein
MKRSLLFRALPVLVAAALALTGCGNASTAPSPAKDASTALLARFGLGGYDAVEVIDHLDRLGGADRPADLTASVRPSELQLSAGDDKATLPIPEDRFYLSVAPYVDSTHECFYHSLTTCKGELGGKEVHVRIEDTTHGTVLVDRDTTTFANGFVGFWLPRDIEGTVRIGYDGRSAETTISTDRSAPTCLTTLKLV